MNDINRGLICTKDAARLMGVTLRTVQRMALDGRIECEIVPSVGGRAGEALGIQVSSLPTEARIKYAAMQDDTYNGNVDLVGYKSKYGQEGVDTLMKRLDAVKEMKLYTEMGQGNLMEKRAEVAERLGVSVPTLYRYEQQYEKNALSGIMDTVERADKGQPRNICRMAQDYIHAETCLSTRPTNRAIYGRLISINNQLGEGACDQCPYNPASDYRAQLLMGGKITKQEICDREKAGMVVPASYTTVDRYIKQIPDSVKALGRYGAKYWEANFMPKTLRKKPDYINEVWFGDHHVFDIFVTGPDGRPVRPWLTALMDAKSGKFIGPVLSLGPNSRTIMEGIKRAAGRTIGSDVYGLPMALYIDNGKDYRCKMIEGDGLRDYSVGRLNVSFTDDNALLKTLGIGVHHAIPYRAWSKTIERAFRTLESRWVQGILPGWCANSSDERPESLNQDIREGKLLNYEEFAAYVFNVMLPEYHALKGEDGLSPDEIYQSGEKARMETVSWAVLHEASAMRDTRKVGTTGIKFAGRVYNHPDLTPLIGQWVTITYDSKDSPSIGVLNGNKFVCEAEEADRFRLIGEDNVKLEAHMARQQAAKKANRAALQLPVERIKALNDMIYEREDIETPATLTTVVHERAHRERQAAKGRADALRGKKSADELAASRKIKAQLAQSGSEMIEMLRAAEG